MEPSERTPGPPLYRVDARLVILGTPAYVQQWLCQDLPTARWWRNELGRQTGWWYWRAVQITRTDDGGKEEF